jgi:hypothetical protein
MCASLCSQRWGWEICASLCSQVSYCCNEVLELDSALLSPPSGRAPHHCKARLKNPKSSFYIFFYNFLCSCKVNFLIPLWTLESLHKCRPRRAYLIHKIVPHGVFVVIHHILNLWCYPRSQTLKKWRHIQDIDIIQRTRKSKECMSNP